MRAMRGSILGLRASAITASQTLQLPGSARALSLIQGSGNGSSSSGGGSKCKNSDEEGDSTRKGADSAEERLQELLQTVRSDAYSAFQGALRILSFSLTCSPFLPSQNAGNTTSQVFSIAKCATKGAHVLHDVSSAARRKDRRRRRGRIDACL